MPEGNLITGDGVPNPAPTVVTNWGELPEGREVEHLNAVEKELVDACYDSAVAYVDAQLERLFERLAALDLKVKVRPATASTFFAN